MRKQKVFQLIIGIVVISGLFLIANTATAQLPLVSPFDNGNDNTISDDNEQIDFDYDPCALTAYGEPLYLEDDTTTFLSTEELESEYQRGRMAFLFGNYEFAYRIWEPLAYQGYSKAQATLAWMFHTGKGVKTNMKRALAWYRVAADKDNPIAQNNLGVFYEQGIEVGKSYRRAAQWYKKSAEVGYPFAQYNLGVLYLNGKGVKKNQDEAIYWLQIASLQGVKQAGQLLEKLGKHAAPKDDIHKTKPKKKYHNAPLPDNVATHEIQEKIHNAKWVAAQNPKSFTLHLAGGYDLNSLLTLARSVKQPSNLAYFEVPVQGRSWFNLLYGSYANEASAKKEMEKLPEDLKSLSPLVRQFSELQATIIHSN